MSAPDTSCNAVLRQGCSGTAVSRLQKLLRDRGFTTSPVDGAFGPKTERGLQAFEATKCGACTADAAIGIDSAEWRALEAVPLTKITTTTEKSR